MLLFRVVSEKSKDPLEKLMAIWTKLVEIIKKIISFIINPGARI